MRLEFSEVARRFILFPDRVDKNIIIKNASDQCKKIVDSFVRDLEVRAIEYRVDDIRSFVDDFFEVYQNLPDWYGAALDTQRITIGFDLARPRIRQDGIGRWRRLSVSLDPDALIALEFARQYSRPAEQSDLANWGVYAETDDFLLSRLFQRGLSDIHTHLEGCVCIPLLWRKVVLGTVRREWLAEYRKPRIEDLPPSSALRTALIAEIAAIANARESWRKLVDMASDRGWLDAFRQARPGAAFLSDIAAQLWPERCILTAVWHALLVTRESSNQKVEEAAKNLDRYLLGKHLFLQRHVQYQGTNPGLSNFRRFFDRGRTMPPKRTPRLEWQRRMELIEFACESPHLNAIEFRISPLHSVREYFRFFKEWQAQEKIFLERRGNILQRSADSARRRRPLRIRFVVHMIRQEGAAREHDTDFAFERVRRVVDRQSAVLHRFRMEHPELASAVVGIDVANIERNSPIDVFTPYLRLLRGDGLCANVGEQDDEEYRPENFLGSPFLSQWRQAIERNEHRVPPASMRLGLTCHAGEDFYHPLDGLRAIWHLLHQCNMRGGDRLGHALALGIDIREFNVRYGDSIIVPRGEALDSLVWLYRRMGAVEGTSERLRRDIDDEIARLSRSLYGKSYPPELLYRVQKLRHLPVLPRSFTPRGDDAAAITILDQELTDRVCRRERIRPDTCPSVYSKMTDDLERVQRQLVDEVVRRDVIIETNPSSNLATGGFGPLRWHPMFSLLAANPAVKITINCDDPGTFATRLETEFALVREAMAQRNMAGTEIVKLLEDMVDHANWASFGGQNSGAQPG